jgi:hypothetical protein
MRRTILANIEVVRPVWLVAEEDWKASGWHEHHRECSPQPAKPVTPSTCQSLDSGDDLQSLPLQTHPNGQFEHHR